MSAAAGLERLADYYRERGDQTAREVTAWQTAPLGRHETTEDRALMIQTKDRERALWVSLADEVDTYLGRWSDPTTTPATSDEDMLDLELLSDHRSHA